MWFWISFLLAGIFIYFPVGLLLWAAAAAVSKSSVGPTIFGVLLVVLAFLFHGSLFGWYDHLEAPSGISITIDSAARNDFFSYEEKDGKSYVTLTDTQFSEKEETHLSSNSGSIRFDVKNKDAKKSRANLKWTITIDGKEYERNTIPAGIETRLFSDNFSLKIGETVATITAKNDLGEFTRTIVINKLSTETECAKSENAEMSICQQVAEARSADAEEAAAKQAAKEAAKQKTSTTTNNNTSSGITSTSTCGYYRYGKCWDDVIERAAEDGAMDGWLFGSDYDRYSYYDGCEGVCTDIYEDSYWDARMEYGGKY